jgi:uncharacterized iron-regulated protein
MSLKTDLEEAKSKLAELEANYQLVKADVEAKAKVIEAELAALPAELIGKGEAELATLYHKIVHFFGGADKVPADPTVPPAA